MTKCNKSEVNLKSTAYNQNGQNYFEQLTAYNSMSAHLRRTLLAKCVVDAKNKAYMHKRKQMCKIDWKPQFVKSEITNNIIDRLAYDTLYHPVDFLRMYYGSKHFCQCEAEKCFTTSYEYDMICSQSKLHNHITCPSFKTNNTEQFISNNKNAKRRSYTQSSAGCKKIFRPVDLKAGVKIHDRFEENSIFYESASDFLSQDINHLSSAINTSRSYGNCGICSNLTDKKTHVKEEEEEEVRYVKFVYEITREIIHNGLYTDEELHEVFKKHVEENKTVLNVSRMLSEIYQLKLALNISTNTEDEELKDFAHAQQLLNRTFRPPTPPKILNENRVTEKLMWYQKLDEFKRDSLDPNNKSVVLVDANPELHVTERDVLTLLVEADINPEQAGKIYRKLYVKSKEPSPLIKTEIEQSNGEHEVEENFQLNRNLMELRNVRKVNEQGKSSD